MQGAHGRDSEVRVDGRVRGSGRNKSRSCSGKQNKYLNKNMGFWPNPAPGRRPMDSGRGDVEFAGVFASVVSMAVSFVTESTFWNLAEKKRSNC